MTNEAQDEYLPATRSALKALIVEAVEEVLAKRARASLERTYMHGVSVKLAPIPEAEAR